MQIAPPVIPSEPANSDADNLLSEFAHRLAKTHTVDISRSQKTDLLKSLEIWELALRKTNALFKTQPAKDAPVSRAGEWMLDNFYIVKQTFRQIEEDLPTSFLKQLPKLEGEPGLPRIFMLAREWIGYCQSQLDLTLAAAFVQTYQQVGAANYAAHRGFGTTRLRYR